MSDRTVVPYVVAGTVATAGVLYYTFSSLSKSKSNYAIPAVTISTPTSAREVYFFFRDPANYLNLTPESQYTIVTFSTSPKGVDYTLHHQITKTQSKITECRRDWNDEDMVFWDTFPVLEAPFKVLVKVTQKEQGRVEVQAEVEIEASAGFRGFFGIVTPKRVAKRLQRLREKYEKKE